MSRGYGTCQRRVVDALVSDAETLERGLPLDALRPFLPHDRSNRRRVIASLIEREDVELVTDEETGEQHLRLAFPASLWAWARKQEDERRAEEKDTHDQWQTYDQWTIPPMSR